MPKRSSRRCIAAAWCAGAAAIAAVPATALAQPVNVGAPARDAASAKPKPKPKPKPKVAAKSVLVCVNRSTGAMRIVTSARKCRRARRARWVRRGGKRVRIRATRGEYAQRLSVAGGTGPRGAPGQPGPQGPAGPGSAPAPYAYAHVIIVGNTFTVDKENSFGLTDANFAPMSDPAGAGLCLRGLGFPLHNIQVTWQPGPASPGPLIPVASLRNNVQMAKACASTPDFQGGIALYDIKADKPVLDTFFVRVE